MSELTTFAGIMLAISMAVERCVEIMKGIFPTLGVTNPDSKKEARRAACLQALAVVFGTIIAELSQAQLKAAVPTIARLVDGSFLYSLGSCLLVGFMASGGSGLWNHLLDLVGSLKIQQEQEAKQQVMQTQQLAAKAAAA